MCSFRLHIQAAPLPRSTVASQHCGLAALSSLVSVGLSLCILYVLAALWVPTTSQDPNTCMLDYMCCPYNRLVHQIMLKISYNTDYNN